MTLPIIDLGQDDAAVARAIRAACEEVGFFYVVGHGIPEASIAALKTVAASFFQLPLVTKQKIAMSLGGRAWRGFFPLEGELTSGQPDQKEGIYFGSELGPEDPRVEQRLPLHGPNLWPAELPEMRTVVLDYLAAATAVAHRLMRAISRSLSLDEDYFSRHYTADPIVLFRIFNYPGLRAGWGVGEHTDYGLLTLLLQDDVAGLEVKTKNGWISAPPIPGSLVCNLGDMLDRMTGGRYRSTPHRVKNEAGRARTSYAFFFDPAWTAELLPLPGLEVNSGVGDDRWDGANVHAYTGTYGEYLVEKVARVFPELAAVLKS